MKLNLDNIVYSYWDSSRWWSAPWLATTVVWGWGGSPPLQSSVLAVAACGHARPSDQPQVVPRLRGTPGNLLTLSQLFSFYHILTSCHLWLMQLTLFLTIPLLRLPLTYMAFYRIHGPCRCWHQCWHLGKNYSFCWEFNSETLLSLGQQLCLVCG